MTELKDFKKLVKNFEKYLPENYTDEDMTKALYIAAGIGGVIAKRASLSGAEGGCQAEIGSASAMASGALVEMRGGTPLLRCRTSADGL